MNGFSFLFLPCFLRLDLGLHLMLIRGLEPPERVGAVPIPVKELCCLGCVVQHVLSRKTLSLADVTDLKAKKMHLKVIPSCARSEGLMLTRQCCQKV